MNFARVEKLMQNKLCGPHSKRLYDLVQFNNIHACIEKCKCIHHVRHAHSNIVKVDRKNKINMNLPQQTSPYI